MLRGGILGVRCGEILLISYSALPGLGRVSAKNVNKLTDFNAAVSSPGNDPFVDAAESASFPLPGTGRTEGGEKTQPLHRFSSHLVM